MKRNSFSVPLKEDDHIMMATDHGSYHIGNKVKIYQCPVKTGLRWECGGCLRFQTEMFCLHFPGQLDLKIFIERWNKMMIISRAGCTDNKVKIFWCLITEDSEFSELIDFCIKKMILSLSLWVMLVMSSEIAPWMILKNHTWYCTYNLY